MTDGAGRFDYVKTQTTEEWLADYNKPPANLKENRMSENKEYDNDNQAAVWKNENRKEEWHAVFNGNATIGGVEYFIDVTVTSKEDLENNPKMPRMRMKFKEKSAQVSKPAPAFEDDLELGDIPF